MKPKTTTDTQSVKTVTEHMVNVHVPCRGQQYHFQVVVIDAYHDTLAELLDAKGVAHLPDAEWQF